MFIEVGWLYNEPSIHTCVYLFADIPKREIVLIRFNYESA